MTRNFKFFLIPLFLSLPIFWGLNLLEKELKDFFFWWEISRNSQIFTAQIALEEQLENSKPFKKNDAVELEINAKSAISVFLNNEGQEQILFGKEPNEKSAIASLTKLMTALVVLENYDLSKEIKISQKSVSQEEDLGQLKAGKVFKVEYLLYPLLIESSNDAAFALANDYDGMTEEKFVDLMNSTAEKLELSNTFFINPTGLDEDGKKITNYSTAADLVKLTKELLKKPLIWEILSIPHYETYGPELTNINKLLEEENGWRTKIIGGKTGFTKKAGGCMILVLEAPKGKGFIINVVLGASGPEERFEETKKLVDWINNAYKW